MVVLHMFFSFALSVIYPLSVSSESTISVESCSVDSGLKGPEVDWQKVEPSSLFLLSSGKGRPSQETVVRVCHNGTHLFVRYDCEDNNISTVYHKCDDPVWQADAVEFMISPGSVAPQVYHELDLGPYPSLFAATINNPHGNCTGIRDNYLHCNLLNMTWEAHQNYTLLNKDGWWAVMTIPFHFLNNADSTNSSQNHGTPIPTTWRANFYRVDTPKGSGMLEYSSWQPTDKDPPCFHVPSKFGVLHIEI